MDTLTYAVLNYVTNQCRSANIHIMLDSPLLFLLTFDVCNGHYPIRKSAAIERTLPYFNLRGISINFTVEVEFSISSLEGVRGYGEEGKGPLFQPR